MKKFFPIILISLIVLLFPVKVHAADYQASTINIYPKNEATGDVISGVELGLYCGEDLKDKDGNVIMAAGTIIQKATSGSDGAHFNLSLPCGRLYVKETKVPDGYKLSDAQCFIVIVKGCEDYNEYIYNEVDSNLLTFTPSFEKQEDGVYKLSVSNIRVNSLQNIVLVEDLPYNAHLIEFQTGVYSEKFNYDIYYKTNKCADWRLLKRVNSKNATLLSNPSDKEEITSIFINYGNVNLSSVTNPYFTFKCDGYVPSRENRITLSGYSNKTKVMSSSIEQEFLTAPANNLTDEVTVVQRADGTFEPKIETEEKTTFETVKETITNTITKTGDTTPLNLYIIIFIVSSLLISSGIFVLTYTVNKRRVVNE